MAINETIVTGRKFRKLTDEATKQWQRFSFWTKASDVEFDDGNTLEDKIVNINGTADLLQEQVNNLNTDANGKINNLITEINGLKETVEDLKTNPPSPPSPPEQNLPLVLTGEITFFADETDDENDDLLITPWKNGTAAYLSSPGIVKGEISLKYVTDNGKDPLFDQSGYAPTGYTDLYLLSYPNKSYIPPMSERTDQYNNDNNFYANIVGKIKRDGVIVLTQETLPAGYLWIGSYTLNVIPLANWYGAVTEHVNDRDRVYFKVDFSKATFQQT